jgi:hypothetical protein
VKRLFFQTTAAGGKNSEDQNCGIVNEKIILNRRDTRGDAKEKKYSGPGRRVSAAEPAGFS